MDIFHSIFFFIYRDVYRLLCCAQSCLTPCNPMDCSPPGSCVQGISQARYWSELPFPILGELPKPGTEPISLASSALAGRIFTTESPGEDLPVSQRCAVLHKLETHLLGLYACSQAFREINISSISVCFKHVGTGSVQNGQGQSSSLLWSSEEKEITGKQKEIGKKNQRTKRN